MRHVGHHVRLVLVAVIVTLVAVSTPIAQETTGSIAGTVQDTDGAVLPGVVVTATGPVGSVTSVTNERGEYRFPRLPSGRYSVSATLDGFAAGEGNVDLTVGSTQSLNFTLTVAGVTETVTVTAEAPVIDVTSTATTTSISREQIELVPRGRDFSDVVAQAAGAFNESQAGGISIDGSSGS